MCEAVLLFSTTNLLRLSHSQKVFFHWILQVIGTLSTSIGIIIVVVHKCQKDKPHLKSFHSIIGLISVLLIILAALSGVLVKFSINLRSFLKLVQLKLAHSCFGALNLILAFVSLTSGMTTHFYTSFSSKSFTLTTIFALVLVTMFILFKPIANAFQRIKA